MFFNATPIADRILAVWVGPNAGKRPPDTYLVGWRGRYTLGHASMCTAASWRFANSVTHTEITIAPLTLAGHKGASVTYRLKKQ